MKFTITTETLKSNLAKLSNPPGEEPAQMGSLAVVISASEFEGLTLRRTTALANLCIAMEADVADEGEVGVPHEMFAQIINGYNAKQIELTLEGKKLFVRAGKRNSFAPCFEPEDILPPTAFGAPTAGWETLSTDLERYLNDTACAASTNPGEPKFAGVCLRNQQGQVTFFAADRRRIHVVLCGASKTQFAPQGTQDAGVLLTSPAIAALRRLISGPESKIGLQVADGGVKAAFSGGSAIFSTGADCPPYLDAVLPWGKAPTHTAQVNKGELTRIIKAAAPLGFQDDKVITVKFVPGAVQVLADNEKGGGADDEIEAETSVTKGETLHRVKGQWLAELLDHTQGDTVTLEYHEPQMLCTRNAGQMMAVMLTRDRPAETK